jgi:hypothetical protein
LTRETRDTDDSLTVLHHWKEEMERKQGEILVLKNEIQWSKFLKEEMESKQGKILTMRDKIQKAKPVLLRFHKT